MFSLLGSSSVTLLLVTVLFEVLRQIYCLSQIPLLMPHVQPTVNDTYLCTSFRMPVHENVFIVGFKANATKETAHHILIYGCATPGYWERDTPRTTWDCGEIESFKTKFHHKPACGAGTRLIYAWALDAPSLQLPDGVGFKVGKGTGINYLVLQVHYAHVEKFLNGATDDSGILLQTSPGHSKTITKTAGVMRLNSGGEIKARSTVYMETACPFSEDFTLHPFAFRTHTHKLGLLVSGYVEKPDNTWTLIGKHDPQQPQAARCTMRNFRDHVTVIGSRNEDEMCGFYVMYYVDGHRIPDQKFCFSAGPPMYSWARDETLREIPRWVERDASTFEN